MVNIIDTFASIITCIVMPSCVSLYKEEKNFSPLGWDALGKLLCSVRIYSRSHLFAWGFSNVINLFQSQKVSVLIIWSKFIHNFLSYLANRQSADRHTVITVTQSVCY